MRRVEGSRLMKTSPVVRPCGQAMENDRIAKSVCVGKCVGSRSVGRPRKRWIDTMNECLRKRSLDVRLARRMFQDRSEWRGLVRRNAWGVARGMILRP